MAKEQPEFVKIGNTTFRTASLKGMTEEQFMKTYSRIISTGAKEAWKQLKKFTKVDKKKAATEE